MSCMHRLLHTVVSTAIDPVTQRHQLTLEVSALELGKASTDYTYIGLEGLTGPPKNKDLWHV